jgi:hypothetical protein
LFACRLKGNGTGTVTVDHALHAAHVQVGRRGQINVPRSDSLASRATHR